ncbi:MAG: hypothetical protein LBH05_08615 [Deferribacteraceae bacterium]|nr:hypothetical protein [Deferribacteraceae bacterium]
MSDIKYSDFLLKKIIPPSDDYTQALKIHANEMDERFGNDADKIDYWVKYPNEGTQCNPYGFYRGGAIIGFLLLTVYRSEGFLFGDYLSISLKARGVETVRAFLHLIREELDKTYHMPMFFDIASEDRRRRGAERLYKTAGAGLLEYKHFIPRCDLTFEKIPARMLIYPSQKNIDKNTYSRFLRTILLKNQVESLSPFLNTEENAAYKRYISEIYNELTGAMPDTIHIT